MFDSKLATYLAHGITQGAFSVLRGGSFKTGFISGFAFHLLAEFESSLIDADDFTKLTINAIISGAIAKAAGGEFSEGAFRAMVVWLYNYNNNKERQEEINRAIKILLNDNKIPETYKEVLRNTKIIYVENAYRKVNGKYKLTFGTTSADFKIIRLTSYIWTYWEKQLKLGNINKLQLNLTIDYQIKQTLLHECRHVFLKDNSHNNIPHSPDVSIDASEVVKTNAFNLEVKLDTGY